MNNNEGPTIIIYWWFALYGLHCSFTKITKELFLQKHWRNEKPFWMQIKNDFLWEYDREVIAV